MPAAIIFDNDGLTLDTEHTWTRAEAALYARYGTQFTLDHKREMLGTSGEKSALTMERHLGPAAGTSCASSCASSCTTSSTARASSRCPV